MPNRALQALLSQGANTGTYFTSDGQIYETDEAVGVCRALLSSPTLLSTSPSPAQRYSLALSIIKFDLVTPKRMFCRIGIPDWNHVNPPAKAVVAASPAEGAKE